MPKEISIDEVYSRLRSVHINSSNSCRLTVVRSSGKNKGDVIIIPRARYGSPRRRVSDTPTGVRKRSNNDYEHNDNGTFPMTNVDRNKYISPLLSHIIGYNEYRVIH